MVSGQSPANDALPKGYKAPRTPDGRPDLQGIWSNAVLTPLERPANLAGKEFFTAEEAEAYENQVIEANNRDRRDGSAEEDLLRAYNEFWWDRGTKVVATRRTSLIIDPPDGRLPAQTPEARQRAAARNEARRGRATDGPEFRSMGERCIHNGAAGPPMMPASYNNNFQIVQTPQHVMILNEMIHDARIVPLDGRPQIPANVRQLLGSSRGRWEGETLVVETTHFTDKINYRGTTPDMKLTERFTRVADDILLYEFTVDDPATFVRPWTAQITARKADALIYEFACHEGNEAMFGVLGGARAEEKKAAEGK
jgi:hypothetical protein